MYSLDEFERLHKLLESELEIIKKYIKSTPWCEEGQEAYDSTGYLKGFLEAFGDFMPQMIIKLELQKKAQMEMFSELIE